MKFEGLGTYAPSIDLKGQIKVMHRADRSLVNALNAQGAYQGKIENRGKIGKSVDDLVASWNAQNPGEIIS